MGARDPASVPVPMAQGSVGVRVTGGSGRNIPRHRVGEGPVIRTALVAPEVLVAPVGGPGLVAGRLALVPIRFPPSLADSQADLVVRVARVATCFRVVPAGQGADLAVVVS